MENNSEKKNTRLAVVVLAAGKGKRMNSGVPKVLHEICGRPLIGYVLEATRALGAGEVVVVVGNGAEEVERVAGEGCRYARQAEQKGTGHAVMVALEEMDARFEEVLVLAGDAPFVTAETLQRLVEARRERQAAASVMTAELPDPGGYGRIVRTPDGEIKSIVEEADATGEERATSEVNSCTYVFDRATLEREARALTTDNAQGEYYLTDVIENFTALGQSVVAVRGAREEALGVNSRSQLAVAGRVMRARINDSLMAGGVELVDPCNTYIDYDIEIGRDTVVMPMVFMTGATTVGRGCHVGPCSSINDSIVGDGCDIQFSVVDGCELSTGATVGPFSRLRPGCELGQDSKAGSFVEMKKTTLGRRGKVPHLSYMGDAQIGEDANIGAGSVTCNYDGENKHPTTIGARAFIGSDTMLLAPVDIGDDAVTGAGSVISEDVPDGALGIERSRQKIISDYDRKKKGKTP
ncbi:MAG: bifunctional UDP-N-acetylglucosamine diphosphorylase/glucosamine-1-phosphate N-acetyltransferase GlmU [Candidatus Anoxymicrobium japonicum]|uniref:Bifunctional protein GlmU n=1 Tax=Candidatus Anoxymicrobium japonicum TaxID=2013648 RepID=A0A2N3G5K0_9ACTN|nr:MAG: bifunctional UDP-N-acetylglucosamine diphosphorylase/glucosamine-1-phosphate N-acetyltransferase GlmU [Candidatus Anoxymicrobium japonicum]